MKRRAHAPDGRCGGNLGREKDKHRRSSGGRGETWDGEKLKEKLLRGGKETVWGKKLSGSVKSELK